MAIDITALDASSITAGIMPAVRLGSGTISTSTYLRGDGSWAAPSFILPGSSGQVLFNSGGVLSVSPNLSFNSSTSVLTATNFVGAGAGLTNLNASYFVSGTVSLARVGSGGFGPNTYLRGDSSWIQPPLTPPAGVSTQVQFNNSGVFGAGTNFTYNGVNPPLVQVSGELDVYAVAGYSPFRYRDNSNNIKGGFTPYGTAFGTVAGPCACGRLTYDANNPTPTADFIGANATTLYYLPCNGSFITLFNSNYNDYEDIKIPDAGLSVSLAGSGVNAQRDVFVRNNLNGTASLILGAVWNGNNDRSNAFLMGSTAGMYFQTGNQNARYVGTMRTWGATPDQGIDVNNVRGLWNAYNQVPRKVLAHYTNASSWNLTVPTTNTTLVRAVNADDVNCRFYFLIGGTSGAVGLAGNQFLEVDSSITIYSTNGLSCAIYHGVGLDQATASSFSNDMIDSINTTQLVLLSAKYSLGANLTVGLHWLTLMEGLYNNSGASASVTVYSNSAFIHGYFMC